MSFDVEYIIKMRDNASRTLGVLNKRTKKLNLSFQNIKANVKSLASSLGRKALFAGAIGAAGLLTAGFVSMVKISTEFEKKLSDLQAVTGSTSSEMKTFEDQILSVARVTDQSARKIADAFGLVGSAKPELLGNAFALGEVTKQVVILSKASGLELTDASNIVTKSLNQFGAGAGEAAKFVDILATSQQKGTARIEALGESFKNSGSILKSLNVSFEDSNAIFQAFAKGGLEGAEAGTALSSILAKLSKNTDKNLNPVYTEFTEIIKNLKAGNLDLVGAIELVDAEQAKNLLTLVNQNETLQNLKGNLNEVGNASSQAATRFDNLTGDLEKLSNQWETFILDLKEGRGAIARVARGITKSLSSLFENFRNDTVAAELGLERGLFQDFGAKQKALIGAYEKANETIFKLSDGKTQEQIQKTIEQLQKKQLNFGEGEEGTAKIAISNKIIKGLQEVQKGIKKGGLIEAPKVDESGKIISNNTKERKKIDSGINEITSQAPKVFNINIENLVKEFQIKTTNLKESSSKVKEEITKVMIAAVNDVSIIDN